MTVHHAVIETDELGALTVRSDGDAITGLYFEDHWYLPPPEELGERVHPDDDALIRELGGELLEYFSGRQTAFTVALRADGDPFRQAVWDILRTIPYGETTTYGAIAERLGRRTLAQAVGQAVGHNPISIVIPCHRVVGATGKLTGFAGGLDRKLRLLELEEPVERAAERLF